MHYTKADVGGKWRVGGVPWKSKKDKATRREREDAVGKKFQKRERREEENVICGPSKKIREVEIAKEII